PAEAKNCCSSSCSQAVANQFPSSPILFYRKEKKSYVNNVRFPSSSGDLSLTEKIWEIHPSGEIYSLQKIHTVFRLVFLLIRKKNCLDKLSFFPKFLLHELSCQFNFKCFSNLELAI